jgi:hypothetical protein
VNVCCIIAWLLVTRAMALPFAPITSPPRPPADLTADDVEIMNLCFDTFVNHEHSPFRGNPINHEKKLVVHRLTCDPLHRQGRGQIEADMGIRRLNGALFETLLERSKRTARANLDAFRPTGKRVLVSDIDRVPSRLGGPRVELIDPQAYAFARVWLPAYADHSRRAIFRFAFGPSGHGATATFLLRRDDAGKWIVTTCSLAYYA